MGTKVKKKRNILNKYVLLFLVAMIIIIVSIFNNLKTNDVIEISAIALNNYNSEETEEFNLEAIKTGDDIYEIELPEAINGKKIAEVLSVSIQTTDALEITDNKIIVTEEQLKTQMISLEVLYDAGENTSLSEQVEVSIDAEDVESMALLDVDIDKTELKELIGEDETWYCYYDYSIFIPSSLKIWVDYDFSWNCIEQYNEDNGYTSEYTLTYYEKRKALTKSDVDTSVEVSIEEIYGSEGCPILGVTFKLVDNEGNTRCTGEGYSQPLMNEHWNNSEEWVGITHTSDDMTLKCCFGGYEYAVTYVYDYVSEEQLEIWKRSWVEWNYREIVGVDNGGNEEYGWHVTTQGHPGDLEAGKYYIVSFCEGDDGTWAKDCVRIRVE